MGYVMYNERVSKVVVRLHFTVYTALHGHSQKSNHSRVPDLRLSP